MCLETLRELALADPRIVAHANGIRVLLSAAIDPATQVCVVSTGSGGLGGRCGYLYLIL